MFELIRQHQLNLMLALCAICMTMAGLLLVTRFLSRRRKWILIVMEMLATFLLAFDRASYIYKGDASEFGFLMIRLSNFMVFFLTPAIVLTFSLYLTDLLLHEGGLTRRPLRLKIVNIGAVIGMALIVVSHFTGFYYYFDEQNIYHRGAGFPLSYIVPVICPLILYSVIRQYRKSFSRLIYISLVLYIFLPIVVGIIQFFTYGLSIVTMAMVLVSICLYIFTYLDINNAAEKAHELEVGNLQKEQESMHRLFDQTVNAFVAAIEKRDEHSEGHSVRVADYARRIARAAGKSEEECSEVYYAALLHDVGLVGIPDSVLCKPGKLTEEEMQLIRKKPVLGGEILSSITEYPYLSTGARYSREHYDGTGYPEGLRGNDIPEISRIIAVADAYDTMITGKHTRAPLSYQVVREEFIKESGQQFDPEFSEIMIQMMDEDHARDKRDTAPQTETELECRAYRDAVSSGIRITRDMVRIRFSCEAAGADSSGFSAPSLILFDSYDRHVHDDARTIKAYQYLEYGELWFDGNFVCTNARNIEASVTDQKSPDGTWEILAGRYEDHLSIRMVSPERTVEVIVALPDNSKASYIGLTGENCHIRDIAVTGTGEKMQEGSVRKIVSKILYTDRLESDLPNIQIDQTRSAATPGVPVTDTLVLDFHTISLPSANLVWHCPYIVLFGSDDGKVGGKGYKEYALIKLGGEGSGDTRDAENRFTMKKTADFPGWEAWKTLHKEGLECSVRFLRKGGKITVSAETLGIAIEHTLLLHDKTAAVYAALTGDQVALTDIRVR
ncbi:MAG: HD domain-containing protein [Oscillospiraceae bacterium]|nr:HD domain-containing protein [Oscillospiraceae bacterium]